MKDEHLLRYGKQMLVPGFGLEAQRRLLQSKVLVVGIGGLGCPAALYLATSGVGTLMLADDDRVELDNLYRQILYRNDAIGNAKTEAAGAALSARCPETHIELLPVRMQDAHLQQYVPQVDAVVDASDNATTRFAINRSCYAHRKPLISAAAIRAEGQIAVFDFRNGLGPCYACLYPTPTEDAQRCGDQGVISAVVGLVGLNQALETIKLLSGYGTTNTDKLLALDGATNSWRVLALTPDPNCTVCNNTTRMKTAPAS